MLSMYDEYHKCAPTVCFGPFYFLSPRSTIVAVSYKCWCMKKCNPCNTSWHLGEFAAKGPAGRFIENQQNKCSRSSHRTRRSNRTMLFGLVVERCQVQWAEQRVRQCVFTQLGKRKVQDECAAQSNPGNTLANNSSQWVFDLLGDFIISFTRILRAVRGTSSTGRQSASGVLHLENKINWDQLQYWKENVWMITNGLTSEPFGWKHQR